MAIFAGNLLAPIDINWPLTNVMMWSLVSQAKLTTFFLGILVGINKDIMTNYPNLFKMSCLITNEKPSGYCD